MEFISAEEFLKQDEEVQKVFLDWFENEACSYDIVVFKNDLQYVTFYGDIEYQESFNYEDRYIPLLTEGQIREFIEDKIHAKIRIIPTNIGYRIIYLPGKGTDLIDKCYEGDLLQVYWKVAVQIAKESIKH